MKFHLIVAPWRLTYVAAQKPKREAIFLSQIATDRLAVNFEGLWPGLSAEEGENRDYRKFPLIGAA